MSHSPQISIITPCFNRAGLISDAIESVLAQDFPDFEHIIIDGGSTDATLSLLSRYTHLHVFSEKDNGIYDALNKGIVKAHGSIVGLLNSDDIYEPGIFAAVVDAFALHPEVDIISGQATYFEDQKGRIQEFFPAVTPGNIEQRLMKGVPIINAWFFRRGVFEKIGSFDQGFPIAADRDFQIRCWLNHAKLYPIERFFYHYRSHRDSLTVNGNLVNQENYLNDILRVAEKYIAMDLENSRIKRKFIEWRDLTLFELFISNMRRRNFQKSLHIVVSTIKRLPAWAFFFILQIPLRSMGYLYRKMKAFFRPEDYGYLSAFRTS